MDCADKKLGDPFSFRKGDALVLALILLAAIGLGGVFLFPGAVDNQVTVEIRQGGRLLESHPLSQDWTATVEGDYQNRIVCRDGAVWVEHSTCPGGDCMHSGKISASGRAIVCLPNRVEIRLVGGRPDQVDMVAG